MHRTGRILVRKLKDLHLTELKTEKKESVGLVIRKQEGLINEAGNSDLHGSKKRENISRRL